MVVGGVASISASQLVVMGESGEGEGGGECAPPTAETAEGGRKLVESAAMLIAAAVMGEMMEMGGDDRSSCRRWLPPGMAAAIASGRAEIWGDSCCVGELLWACSIA